MMFDAVGRMGRIVYMRFPEEKRTLVYTLVKWKSYRNVDASSWLAGLALKVYVWDDVMPLSEENALHKIVLCVPCLPL